MRRLKIVSMILLLVALSGCGTQKKEVVGSGCMFYDDPLSITIQNESEYIHIEKLPESFMREYAEASCAFEDGENTRVLLSKKMYRDLSIKAYDYYSYYLKTTKENEFWPKTKESPTMMVLFQYELDYGDMRYYRDGALGKPEGYDDFFNKLEQMIKDYVSEDQAKTEDSEKDIFVRAIKEALLDKVPFTSDSAVLGAAERLYDTGCRAPKSISLINNSEHVYILALTDENKNEYSFTMSNEGYTGPITRNGKYAYAPIE